MHQHLYNFFQLGIEILQKRENIHFMDFSALFSCSLPFELSFMVELELLFIHLHDQCLCYQFSLNRLFKTH